MPRISTLRKSISKMTVDEVVLLIQGHRRAREAYVPPKKATKPKAEKPARVAKPKATGTRKPRTKRTEITKAEAAKLLEILAKGNLL